MQEPTQNDIVKATSTAIRLWYALAADDDAEVAALLDEAALASLRPAAGLAGRLRAQLGVTMDECRQVGTLDIVELLPGERLRPAFVVERDRRRGEELTFRFELAERDDRWFVDPTGADTEPSIGTLLLGE